MSQRGTTAMVLSVLTSLVVVGDAVYDCTHGRSVEWRWILFGVASVCAAVYFKTVKRPT